MVDPISARENRDLTLPPAQSVDVGMVESGANISAQFPLVWLRERASCLDSLLERANAAMNQCAAGEDMIAEVISNLRDAAVATRDENVLFAMNTEQYNRLPEGLTDPMSLLRSEHGRTKGLCFLMESSLKNFPTPRAFALEFEQYVDNYRRFALTNAFERIELMERAWPDYTPGSRPTPSMPGLRFGLSRCLDHLSQAKISLDSGLMADDTLSRIGDHLYSCQFALGLHAEANLHSLGSGRQHRLFNDALGLRGTAEHLRREFKMATCTDPLEHVSDIDTLTEALDKFILRVEELNTKCQPRRRKRIEGSDNS